jgi:hypothetical protein
VRACMIVHFSVEAERYLNRASELIHLCTDKTTSLAYKVCCDRACDDGS